MKEARTSGPLKGRMRVPGSKSLTNRALVCAALARGTSVLKDASESDDTALLENGLNQLGILVRRRGADLEVEGKGGTLYAPKFPIPSGNAGTTLRFLLSLSALASGKTVIETSPTMAERPNEDIVEALRSLGVHVHHDEHSTRFEVEGNGLAGGEISVRSDRSSQFLSSLLMIAPYARARCTVGSTGKVASAQYLRLTIDVMQHFGVPVKIGQEGERFSVDAPARYLPAVYAVEGDASGATYPFAAAAVAGGEVFVPGILSRSHQPDAAFPGVLQRMGCRVEERGGGTLVSREGPLRGVDTEMGAMPDAVPALAAAALFAEGESRIRGIAHLRFKESNRLEGYAAELRKLGGEIAVEGDVMIVSPRALHGAHLETHDDHRLAMSFAVAGLRVGGVTIGDPECVRKSYPRFWEELDGLIEQSAHQG